MRVTDAAHAFNNTSQADCRYAAVDCADGLPTGGSCSDKCKLPTRVMEACHAGKDFSGSGNEFGWARVLRNIRAAFGPSQGKISDWIRSANDEDALTPAKVYSLLDRRANAIGGSLNTRFGNNKSGHGVDQNP